MHSDRLPKNAEHCLQQAGVLWDELQRQRYLRAGRTWQSLADVEQRLGDGFDVGRTRRRVEHCYAPLANHIIGLGGGT